MNFMSGSESNCAPPPTVMVVPPPTMLPDCCAEAVGPVALVTTLSATPTSKRAIFSMDSPPANPAQP
ncbi:MAG: hypothetical protein ACXWVI_06725 [Methyloceanibacter sp.]